VSSAARDDPSQPMSDIPVRIDPTPLMIIGHCHGCWPAAAYPQIDLHRSGHESGISVASASTGAPRARRVGVPPCVTVPMRRRTIRRWG
jgi:hypothetical protein